MTGFVDDFALAQLKAVLLSIKPQVKIITLSNNIQKFSILEGAFILSKSFSLFSQKSLHVGVIDPGVGSQRKAVIIRAANHVFIGPNNGLFYPAVKKRIQKVWQINEKTVSKNFSNTFHGRDIFAKTAGLLSKGEKASRLGKPIKKSALTPFKIKKTRWFILTISAISKSILLVRTLKLVTG